MSIAKITHVAASRKAPGKCEECGVRLPVGSGYKHMSVGFRGVKRVRCTNCPDWKLSERESGHVASVYAAQEDAHERIDTLTFDDDPSPEDVESALVDILQDVATAAEEASEAYGEAFDNMPEGLQQGDTGQQLEQMKDSLEDYANEVTSLDLPERGDDDLDDWLEGCRQAARDKVDELDV